MLEDVKILVGSTVNLNGFDVTNLDDLNYEVDEVIMKKETLIKYINKNTLVNHLKTRYDDLLEATEDDSICTGIRVDYNDDDIILLGSGDIIIINDELDIDFKIYNTYIEMANKLKNNEIAIGSLTTDGVVTACVVKENKDGLYYDEHRELNVTISPFTLMCASYYKNVKNSDITLNGINEDNFFECGIDMWKFDKENMWESLLKINNYDKFKTEMKRLRAI